MKKSKKLTYTEEQYQAYLAKQRVRTRKHYLENKQKYKDKARAQIKATKAWVSEYKEANPCADCQNTYPACVMDFDHRKDEHKVLEVAKLVNFGLKLVQAEIKKCDLVCSNCHRIRTRDRRLSSNAWSSVNG